MIFVNSLSDVFHKDVPFSYVAAMFGVMGLAQVHQFQVLTKRHKRMVEFYEWLDEESEKRSMSPFQLCLYYLKEMKNSEYMQAHNPEHLAIPDELLNGDVEIVWPLENVWMGVSVEDQEYAEKRIPYLQKVPAAIRFLSMEPLVGEVDDLDLDGIHWVIIGGESGPGSRPMDPDWVRYVRDRCEEEGVPFFMKQWGQYDADGNKARSKKDTGCELDGVDHKEWPVAQV
jgi:protein gp37